MQRQRRVSGLQLLSMPRAQPTSTWGKANAAATEAGRVGQQIRQALSVTATPSVNNAQLAETLRLVNAIKAGLAGVGDAVQTDHSSVSRSMNRNFTDQGVTP